MSLLLDEKCGVVLANEEEGVVIEVMACAVRRATTASLPPGRSRGRVRYLSQYCKYCVCMHCV